MDLFFEMRTQAESFQALLLAAIAAVQLTEHPVQGGANLRRQPARSKRIWSASSAVRGCPPITCRRMIRSPCSMKLSVPNTNDAKPRSSSWPSHPRHRPPCPPSVSGGGQAMQVFVRGNPLKLGEPAPPGFLRILLRPASRRLRLPLVLSLRRRRRSPGWSWPRPLPIPRIRSRHGSSSTGSGITISGGGSWPR